MCVIRSLIYIEADDSHTTHVKWSDFIIDVESKILDKEIILLLSRKFAALLLFAAKFLAKLVCGKLEPAKKLGGILLLKSCLTCKEHF
jgi:hypothetical protein